MVEFSEAIRYPTDRDNWINTFLIGGVLTFFGFLFVPLLLVYGYVMEVIRRTSVDDPVPPEFEAWGKLLLEGFQAWLIGVIYLLIPIIIGGLTFGSAMAAFATGEDVGAVIGAGTLFVGGFATVVLALVFGYMAAAGIVNFARQEHFWAGFDTTILRAVLFDRAFASAYLITIGLFIIVSIIGSIPVVGWILVPFAGFYAMMVAGRLWADGFETAIARSSLPGEVASTATPTDTREEI